MTTVTIEAHPAIEKIAADLAEVEDRLRTPTLADAIRAGGKHCEQHHGGWRFGDRVCALSAAAIAVKAGEVAPPLK